MKKRGEVLNSKPYIEKEISKLREVVKGLDITPTLLIIKVGDDEASQRYINNKINMGKKIGVKTKVQNFKENITQEELVDYIREVNVDEAIHSCLIQLPLPKHIDENTVLNSLDYKKDADGFHSQHLGRLIKGDDCIASCTPKGVMDLLDYYNISIEGKKVTIINRSNIVGKPLMYLILERDGTVVICHSKTPKDILQKEIKSSHIVITAVGIPNFLTQDMISPNTTIVDVSINRDEYGLCGDLKKDDYEILLDKGCNLTPVPGGVGPMTVLSLVKNVIKICK